MRNDDILRGPLVMQSSLRTRSRLSIERDSTQELDSLRAELDSLRVELAIERGKRMKAEFELRHKHCKSNKNIDMPNWSCGNERHGWTEQQWIDNPFG
jgi:hypothetical protein